MGPNEKKSIQEFVKSWEECSSVFGKNSHNEYISMWSIWNDIVILAGLGREMSLFWFDEKTLKIRNFHESEYLLLKESIESKYQRIMTVGESADFLLTILCKKYKVAYISDLREVKFDNEIMSFIDKDSDCAVYKYLTEYFAKL